MDAELLELLGRLGELTSEELEDLEAKLVAAFDDADGAKSKDVELLQQIADAVGSVRAESTNRETAAAAAEETAAQLRSQIHPVDDAEGEDNGEEGEAEGEEDGEEEVPAVDDVEEPEVADGAPLKVAASTKTAKALATKRPTLQQASAKRPAGNVRRPAAGGGSSEHASAKVIARRGVGRLSQGDVIDNKTDLAQLFFEGSRRALSMSSGERVPLFSVETTYPEDRRLGADAPQNMERIDRVTSLEALVASGGLCTPVSIDYTVPVLGADDEPVADSLPSFQATRGGIRYVTPPSLAGIDSSGTSYWTEANDIALNNPATKPHAVLTCGQEVEVIVDAIPTIVKIGNFMDRFSPEQTAADLALIQTAASRTREVHRLGLISGFSTHVSSAKLLGATRDLLATMDQVLAAFRYRHRVTRNAPFRVILPSWTIDMVRADLTRELAHDNDNTTMQLSDADVTSLLASRGIQVTWTMDANAGDQGFAAQAAGAITAWPSVVRWWIFPEGAFQLIDGGRLDLGVVRDSTLNNTNDYQVFTEKFEAIAFRGVESLQVTSTVRPSGGSAAGVDTSSY